MKGQIRIQFDISTGQMMLDAPLSNQAEKDMTIRLLAAAIPIAVNYQASAIIMPPGAHANGNGKPKITPAVVPPDAPIPETEN